MKQWVVNRVGLLNFWYYQNQIFEFSNGRMLLRGTNGSGKSLTMQSLFPVLLDGDTRAGRLDSFGSQDRKMIDYLLGEKGVSERDEGIGYLFLEVKRKDREEYLTVGIGMYGKRGGKLNKWFFAIENNQRIGIDIELYEEPRKNEIIPYTKRKLTNRLADVGRVFEDQRSYKYFVNERIFGFEEIEQFEELIALLINLRSPKLSKDFKPSVIYGILHDSLPKLKDDELLTLAKTIEQLDGHRDRLEDLSNEIRDLKQFARLHRNFKEELDGQIAGKWLLMNDAVHQLTIENRKKEQMIQQERTSLAQLKLEICENQSQLFAINQSIQELSQHEGMNLVQRGQELQEQFERLEQNFIKKQQVIQRKEAQLNEQQALLEQEEVQLQNYLSLFNECLEDNQQYLSYLRLESIDATYTEKMKTQISEAEYRYWQKEVTRKKHHFQQVLIELRKFEVLKEQLKELSREVADLQQQLDEVERDLRQWQQTRQSEIEKWKQALENWHSDAHFQLSSENYQQLLYRMDQLLEEELREDFVLAPLRQSYETAREQNQNALIPLKNQRLDLIEQRQLKELEMKNWQNKKNPEPSRKEERQKNRKKIKEQQEVFSFYQCVDFKPSVSPEQQQIIEGALYASEILDALVSEPGLTLAGDLQILPQPLYFGSTLADFLIVNTEIPRGLQSIVADVIQSILYDEESEGLPVIFSDGTFQVANLIGAMSEDYQAAYIGSASQERYRQQMIATLLIEIQKLTQEVTAIEVEITQLEGQGEQIRTDYQTFPSGQEVYQSITYLKGFMLDYQAKEKEREVKQRKLSEQEQKNATAQKLLHESTTQDGLALRLEIYEEVLNYLENYEKNLNEGYQNYLLYQEKRPMVERIQSFILELTEEVNDAYLEKDEEAAEMSKQERLISENLKQQKIMDVAALQQQLTQARKEQKERQKQVEDLSEQQLAKTASLATNENQFTTLQINLKDSQYKEDYWQQLCRKRLTAENLQEQAKLISLSENPQKLRDLSDRVLRQFNYISDQLSNYQPKILNQIEVELPEEIERSLGDFSQYNHYKEPVFIVENQDYHTFELLDKLLSQQMTLRDLSKKEDEQLFKTIILESIGRVLRSRIQQSMNWVKQMNELLKSRENSSGLTLSIQWKPVASHSENDLGTAKLVELLQKPLELLSEVDRQSIAQHFQEKVYYAQEFMAGQEEEQTTLFQAITQALDYRDWFEFEMKYKRANEGYSPQVLSDRQFNKFSGGEKAVSMYLPLFAAVYSRYLDAKEWSPRMITLDEAFAGIDDTNIADLFAACEELGFNYVMNSQALFGTYSTVSSLMIYELLRPQNMNFVSPICYHWDGQITRMLTGDGDER